MFFLWFLIGVSLVLALISEPILKVFCIFFLVTPNSFGHCVLVKLWFIVTSSTVQCVVGLHFVHS